MKDVSNVLFFYALFHVVQNTSDSLGSNGRMIKWIKAHKPCGKNINVYHPALRLRCNRWWPEYFCFELPMPTPVHASFIPFILEELHLIGHVCPIQPIKVNINLRDVGFEDARWSQLTQGNIKWQAVVLKALNPYILLAYCLLISISSFDCWYFVSSWNQTGILR